MGRPDLDCEWVQSTKVRTKHNICTRRIADCIECGCLGIAPFLGRIYNSIKTPTYVYVLTHTLGCHTRRHFQAHRHISNNPLGASKMPGKD